MTPCVCIWEILVWLEFSLRVAPLPPPLEWVGHLDFRHLSSSPKCDVYALGGVITELFGCKLLWPNKPAYRIMVCVTVEGEYPPTDHLCKQVRNITVQCFTTPLLPSYYPLLPPFLPLTGAERNIFFGSFWIF